MSDRGVVIQFPPEARVLADLSRQEERLANMRRIMRLLTVEGEVDLPKLHDALVEASEES